MMMMMIAIVEQTLNQKSQFKLSQQNLTLKCYLIKLILQFAGIPVHYRRVIDGQTNTRR